MLNSELGRSLSSVSITSSLVENEASPPTHYTCTVAEPVGNRLRLFPVFRKSTVKAKNTHPGTSTESDEDVEFLSLSTHRQQTSPQTQTRFPAHDTTDFNAVCWERC